ncbi:MAG: hypothetical protein JXB04_10775 [Kiritimatiellae bacterium]|nr:hypothetical protein [Kiritimatiellia bacterium]
MSRSTRSAMNRSMAFAAIAALMIPWSSSAQDAQIIDNTGFERGEVAWGMWGDGDIRDEYHGVKAHEGENFLRLWSRSGWYQDFPTHKDNKYNVAAFVAAARQDGLWGDAFGEIKVEWRKKSGNDDTEIGENSSVKFNLTGEGEEVNIKIPADEWFKVTLPTVKAPDGATHGRVLVTIWTEGDDKGGGCALFDDVSCARVGTPWTE